MERDFYTDDFEQYLREKTDEYRMFPSDTVWKKIHRQLHVYRRWTMFGISALLLGATFLGGRFFLSGTENILADAANNQVTPSPLSTTNSEEETEKKTAKKEPGKEAAKYIAPNQLIIAINNIRERKLSNMLFQDIAEKNDPNMKVAWLRPAEVDSPAIVAAEVPEEKELPAPVVAQIELKTTASFPVKTPESQPVPHLEAAHIEKPSALSAPLQQALTVPVNGTMDIASVKLLEDKPFLSEEDKRHIDNFALNYIPPQRKKLSVQFYVTPTVSYRRLTDWGKNINLNSAPTNLTTQAHYDIDKYVNHKPSFGFEAGSNMLVKLMPGLTLKTGLQFNFSRFQVHAHNAAPETAIVAMSSTTGNQPDTMLSSSRLRNYFGYSRAEVQNQYMQLSMPVGLELRVAGTNKFSFNVAGAVQPTYLLGSNSYMLSSDYKHYVKAPDDLMRRWNLHTNLEAYFAFEKNGLRWQMGPQFRYQMLSSYENRYPIREYVIDYGFKIGVSKIFK